MCERSDKKRSPKKIFWHFGPQFGLKIRGGPGPPRPLPWIRHCWQAPTLTQKLQFLNNVCMLISCEIMHNKDA